MASEQAIDAPALFPKELVIYRATAFLSDFPDALCQPGDTAVSVTENNGQSGCYVQQGRVVERTSPD